MTAQDEDHLPTFLFHRLPGGRIVRPHTVGLRVLLDMSPVGWGKLGLGTYARGLALGLHRLREEEGEDLRVELLYIAPEHPLPPPPGPGFRNRVVRIPHSWLLRLGKAMGLPPLDRWYGADVVHGSAFTAPFSRRPTFLTVHDLSWEAMPETFSSRALGFNRRWHRLCADHALSTGGSLVVPSRFVAGEVARSWRVDSSRIVVTPEAVDPTLFHEPSISERMAVQVATGLERDRYILCLGLVETRKNLIGAIDAWEAYRRRGGTARLVVAGKEGRGAIEVRTRARASSWKDQIQFLGHVPQELLAGLIGNSLVGLYLSRYEGFGLPVLEFLSCGSAIVVSSLSSLPEVWGPGPEGDRLIFDADDAEGVGAGLERLEREPDRLERFRGYARKRAKDFDWKLCARLTLDAWKSARRR